MAYERKALIPFSIHRTIWTEEHITSLVTYSVKQNELE